MHKINIGLTEEQREGVIEILNTALSNTYVLVVRTKKYHWDVVGPQFMTLHKLWDEHYEALSLNIDAYAERVRQLGGYPVGTLKAFLEYASLEEYPGDMPNSTGMVQRLVLDHEQVIRNLRNGVDQCDEDFGDAGTADFLTGLMEAHEEMAWMLRSFLEGDQIQSDGLDATSHSVRIPAHA
jgi:starvation-inducible DNA-binding protein